MSRFVDCLAVEVPFTKSGVWPEGVAPSRFAAHVHQTLPIGCRVAILGLADDLGVRLNRGRSGAAEGPRAFRAALARYGVAHPGWVWPVVLDAGDITPAPGHDEAALYETHRRVTAAVSAILDAGLFPIGIGGGHDLTYPFVRAVTERHGKLAGVYFDAHLDVRAEAGSGMPFRALAEKCGAGPLHVHGLGPFANAAEHIEWFEGHGGIRHQADAPVSLPRQDAFVSMDLDVLDASHAPGVSAMNPAGWPPARLAAWAEAAGAATNVRCFDIMELNPVHDADGRTARVAAHLFLSFLKGFSRRPHA